VDIKYIGIILYKIMYHSYLRFFFSIEDDINTLFYSFAFSFRDEEDKEKHENEVE